MSPEAHFVHRLGLAVACICLALALLTLVATGDFSVRAYGRYMLVRELVSTGAAVLMVAVIGEVCVEERTGRK